MSFKIIGTGRCVPERIVTNDDLSVIMDTSDEWIRQRVGVARRHICTTETADELGAIAAERALEMSGMNACELDLIITATVSGEDVSPSVACMIQRRLGAKCMAFELNAACSSFLFLLETAAAYFAAGYKKILVVGAERLSRIVDWTDRSTAVIFGDGAGAMVLEQGDGYLASTFCVEGSDEVIKIPNHAGNSPYAVGDEMKISPYIHMKGQDTFKYAVNAMCRDIKAVTDKVGANFDDIKYIVPHQANARIIGFAASRLKLPLGKFYQNIERYGNVSSASIPIAFDEMVRNGQLESGDLVLLTAFGGGLASAACLVRI